AQTVVRKTYLLFSSLVSRGFSSSSSEIFLIFHPSRDQLPMVRIVHTVKNPEFRNPLLPLMMASVYRVCLSVQCYIWLMYVHPKTMDIRTINARSEEHS